VLGIVTAVLVGLAVFGGFVNAVRDSADPTPAAAAHVPPLDAPAGTPAAVHTIVFEVTTADGSVNSVNWSTLGDSAVLNDEASPFSKTVTLDRRYGLVGVTASDDTRLRCRLIVDGAIVDEGESDGVVNCSASVR
jgi:hypothetical protein